MNISELKGKKITVMGLGLHGGAVGTVRFLCEAGAKVTVTDIKTKEELAPSAERLKKYKDIRFVFNQHRPEDFTSSDMVVKNPGAKWSNKYIKMALENKIPVEMDSSLFFKLAKNKIIGVTGTKGKTTTSTLIYEILKASGKDVVKVGIGQVSVLDKIKELKKDTIVVFELSSWRLSGLGRYELSPHIAVITNIYPDHLNYYKGMPDYIADKKLICQSQKSGDFCIINCDDVEICKFTSDIKSTVIRVSREKKEGVAVYASGESIFKSDDGAEKKVIDLRDIKLSGGHNLGNVMLAIGAVEPFKIPLATIKKTLAEFSGVVHRLELVREYKGVKYINDTAATTPESAIAGLRSFSQNVILICGGSDKNLDMEQFAREISEHAKGVIFFKGGATDKIMEVIRKIRNDGKDDYRVVETMEKAVELADREARSGDVVLLSPGAASFGLFANEFDRGDKFKEEVRKLK